MKAKEFIEKYVKEKYQDRAYVLGLLGDANWYHIHEDEKVTEEHTPVIRFNNKEGEK